jgi:DNA-directed RNA polymerase subunit F
MSKEDITGLTVRAVEQIGISAAKQLEDAAEQLESEAKVKGDHLRKFAEAIREQTRRASEDLSDFVQRMNDVFKTNENLSHRVAQIPLGSSLKEILTQTRGVGSANDGN